MRQRGGRDSARSSSAAPAASPSRCTGATRTRRTPTAATRANAARSNSRARPSATACCSCSRCRWNRWTARALQSALARDRQQLNLQTGPELEHLHPARSRRGGRGPDERLRALPHRLGVPVHRRRRRPRPVAARTRCRPSARMESRARSTCRSDALIWVMIVPMLLKVDFGALHQVKAALARHRRHAVRQLGGQALLDGVAGLDLRAPRLRALPARRAARQLRRGPDPAGGRTLHGNGVRVEPADRTDTRCSRSARWR